jgi:hypothetical protein
MVHPGGHLCAAKCHDIKKDCCLLMTAVYHDGVYKMYTNLGNNVLFI